MVDWNAIKTEYITDEHSSYRKLAEKYGIPLGTLHKRAKREEWVKLKQQSGDRVVTKSVTAIEKKKADKMTRIQNVADRLLDKIEQAVEELDIQLCKNVEKTKVIEYNNHERPDKPTKEIVEEKETILELKSIIDRKGVQELSAAIKNLKEIQMLKSELDIKEQEARIRNLEKQAQDEDKKDNVTVVFAEEMDEFKV